MNAKTLELALRKQRILFESAHLREDFTASLHGIAPLFHTIDRLRDGAGWLKRHAPLLLALGAGLLVARPRRALGWLRRGFFVWRLSRKISRNGISGLLRRIARR
jgi:hypothetical protein